jgi:hypothetical protein
MMDEAHEGPITHPEEMRASFDLRIGNNINLKGSARGDRDGGAYDRSDHIGDGGAYTVGSAVTTSSSHHPIPAANALYPAIEGDAEGSRLV